MRSNTLAKLMIVSMFLVSCDLFVTDSGNSGKSLFKQIWKKEYRATGFGPTCSPKPIGDSLVAYIGDRFFHIIRAKDGSDKILTQIVDNSQNANMKTGTIYVKDNNIYAFHIYQMWSWDLLSNTVRWQINIPQESYYIGFRDHSFSDEQFFIAGNREIYLVGFDGIYKQTVQINQYPFSSIYADGRVYCGSANSIQGIDSGWITCYDAVTFDSLWAFHTDKGGFSAAGMRPTVENGVLYASATDGPDSKGLLVALNAETGEVIWEQRDIGPIGSAKKAFIDGDIIYGSANLGPFAVNKNTGDVIWFTNVADQVGGYENMPALLNGIMYHVQGNGLFIIDASSGEILEHIYHDSENYLYVSASSNRVFLQTAYAVYCHEPYKR